MIVKRLVQAMAQFLLGVVLAGCAGDLPGYEAYLEKVRWRLILFIR